MLKESMSRVEECGIIAARIEKFNAFGMGWNVECLGSVCYFSWGSRVGGGVRGLLEFAAPSFGVEGDVNGGGGKESGDGCGIVVQEIEAVAHEIVGAGIAGTKAVAEDTPMEAVVAREIVVAWSLVKERAGEGSVVASIATKVDIAGTPRPLPLCPLCPHRQGLHLLEPTLASQHYALFRAHILISVLQQQENLVEQLQAPRQQVPHRGKKAGRLAHICITRCSSRESRSTSCTTHGHITILVFHVCVAIIIAP